MLYLEGKFLSITELEARGPYPASFLVAVFDEQTSDTLHLMASSEAAQGLASTKQFDDVLLALRWRRIDLASLGGTGKGKAYRLTITGVVRRQS